MKRVDLNNKKDFERQYYLGCLCFQLDRFNDA
jgi:hypothetical protein